MSVGKSRTLLGPRLPARVWFAAWCFKRRRADYYEFLAHCLQQSRSNQTLLEIFQQDRLRYGTRSARGVLSGWWSQRYLATGADLAITWRSCLPARDLDCICIAQAASQPALVQTLLALASQTRALRHSATDFWQTTAVGVIALSVALVSLVLMPLYTAPKLVSAFSAVPPALYGESTRRLLFWDEAVQHYWWAALVVAALFGLLLVWSFLGMTGPLRDWLDRLGPWRLYRDIQAMRFLAVSATLLNALQRQGLSLRVVLDAQQRHATQWLSRHLLRMTTRLDLGVDPLNALDTGLLGQEVWWQLTDVVRVHGLSEGLRTASQQICEEIARTIRRRALILRWVLLGLALACVFTVAVWHAQVIEEMRKGLTFFYSQ